MTRPVVEAVDVVKLLGKGAAQVQALKGVSLALAGGQLTLLMGPSGSGKTTLLSALGCMLTPTQGTIRVLDQSAANAGPGDLAKLRRDHIGFVFQSYHLFPTLNAVDNVRVALDVRGERSKRAIAKAKEVLSIVGLSHRLNAFPRELSGGEQQRVAIARAIVGDASAILADEPTGALDSENGHAIMTILARIARESSRAVLVVTHDPRISPFADRIIHMEDGRILGEKRSMPANIGTTRTRNDAEATGNAVDFFLDRHIREGRGARTAFIGEVGSITYEALGKATAGFAFGLGRAAIRREARIALILLDTIAFPIAFWGAMRAGVVPVPVNTLLPAAQIRYILEDCQAEAAIVSAALLPVLAAVLAEVPTLRLVVVAGDDATGEQFADPGALSAQYLGLAAFIAGEDALSRPAAAAADELAFLLYTSGSTGAPKGVRHVHASLRATAETYGAQVLGITAEDLVFSAAKLFFAYGLGNAMTFPMSVGAAAVLSPHRPTPEHVLTVIGRYRPSIFCGVPTLFASLLNHGGLDLGAGSDRLRRCVSAGEALPAQIGMQWALITGVDVLDGVGTTEILHIFLSNHPSAVRYGTSGVAVPGYDLRLVDEHGAEIKGEGAGELLVRGNSIADGYWNQRAKAQRTFRGEWVATGDCYTRDPEGIYRYSGRSDDMFKVGGIWVSPFEVESALISHDAVLEAAVVGDQDKDGLTKPRAFVVLKPERVASTPLIPELQAHVKVQIGPWKYPRWIDIVPDLPKTPTGKIQRVKLRAERLARETRMSV